MHANLIQIAIEALLTLKQKKYRELISSDVTSNNNDNNNNSNNDNNNNNNNNNDNNSNNNNKNKNNNNNDNNNYSSDSVFCENKFISKANLLLSSDFTPSDVYSLSVELQEVS